MLLHQGVYREGAIDLNATYSGLTIASYDPGRPAVISGAVVLCCYTPLANVWVSSVPKDLSFAGLRVNGGPATKARFPNADPWKDLNPRGYVTARTRWIPPKVTAATNPPVDYIVDNE